ncbi:MAG: hypothetical protein ABI999_06730 [Acidobacteriota bacterium]
MKRSVLIFGFVILLSIVNSASAQDSQRIQFERGKSSATVKGTTGENGVYYTVRAKSGQKIIVTVTPAAGVGVKISTDNGTNVLLREEKGGTYEIGLDQNGDYDIFLGSTNGKSRAFTMTVKITKMTDV